MKIAYPVSFEPQPQGGFTVTFPDFPEAITEGDTIEQARFNAAECLSLVLDVRMKQGDAIPLPRVSEDTDNIEPNTATQAAIHVHLTHKPEHKSLDIAVSKLLPIDKLSEYKIHFAVWNGEEQPLDVFVRDQEEWKGWNSWRGQRDRFSRKFIFSLIRYYHQPERWLFGGIFEVIERNADSYTVNLVNLHQEYIGRLLIDHPGAGVKGSAFYLENYFNSLKVAQLFDKPFEGEAFCGYENIEHGFSQLEAIFKQNKSDWKSALENVKGVYLIVDRSNGKMYVGSAYGDSGIWSRWASYIGTGHGWNDELTKLITANGIEHARKNFWFSILEFRSMRTDDPVIISREQYWKRVLQTNPFGYNKN